MAPTATARDARTQTPKAPTAAPPTPEKATAPAAAGTPVATASAEGSPTPVAEAAAKGAGKQLTVVITDAADVRKITILAATTGASRADIARRAVHVYVTSQHGEIEAALRDVSGASPAVAAGGS